MKTADDLIRISEPALSKIHPVLADRVRLFIRYLQTDNLYFGAFMGLRTWEEQNALYAQGRTAPGKIITNAKGGQSWHNFGLAVDMAEDGSPNNAGIQWSWARNTDYLKMGSHASDYGVGLEWGGLWKAFKDYPHVQLTRGLTLVQAGQLYKQGGIQAVWDEITKRLAGSV